MEKNNSSENVSTDVLATEVRGLTDKDAIRTFIDTHLPGWLIASTDAYSIDYPHLDRNWKLICQSLGVQPQKIVVVDKINFDAENTFLKTVCDVLTARGYVIRRKEEFTGCEICTKAIPVREVWQLLKNKNFPVPDEWSSVCSECKK